MKIRILSLTKSREVRLAPLEEEYRKRISKYYSVDFLEMKRERLSDERALKKDWERIKKKAGSEILILLDEKGRMFSSAQLASQLNRWENSGKDLCFVIGGPEGFTESVKKEADMLLSLSMLTLPHKLVCLFLAEALYRANDILKGGPYHRE
jgi:23S rRNA (pseudouridine1915-N3)-methyltransferase